MQFMGRLVPMATMNMIFALWVFAVIFIGVIGQPVLETPVVRQWFSSKPFPKFSVQGSIFIFLPPIFLPVSQ